MTHDDQLGTAFRSARPEAAPYAASARVRPGRSVVRAGTVLVDGAAPVTADLVVDRDVRVALRDGTALFVDVLRPAATEAACPALVVWSPYGKRDGFLRLDDFPFRGGVPQRLLSGLEMFEGPDPGWWCPRGYAIVHADARGAFTSEGRLRVMDLQEGRDGAELVEWVAAQDWCTGRVGMAGTSWPAIAQWFVAAERPPHLAAIAPWEGLDDGYRFLVADGGITDAAFLDLLMSRAVSRAGIEDVPEMLHRDPEFGPYWARKRAAVERIDVPVYAAASWGGTLHTRGTLEAWHRLRVPDRWLRLHAGHQWSDFYDTRHQEDLLRFFDHYLAGKDNGWRATPPVRLTVVDPTGRDVVDRAETAFPVERATERVLHLDAATGALSAEGTPPAAVRLGPAAGTTAFDLTLDDDAEIDGYPRVHLWVAAGGADDLDVFVKLVTLSPQGEVRGRVMLPDDEPEHRAAWSALRTLAEGPARSVFCFDGPWGRLRASRRGLCTDPREEPRYGAEQRLGAGEVVELVVTLSPTALRLHRGDTLRLTVSGVDPAPLPFTAPSPGASRTAGLRAVHTGGDRPSRLVLPLT